MTPDDAKSTLKLIQEYWPKTAWHADIVKRVCEQLEAMPRLDFAMARACLQELRTVHKYQTIQPADALGRLKLIAYPSSGAIGVPTASDARPTLSKAEIDAKRARVKEWAKFTDWQIVAEWFGGVKIKHWRGSWEYWTNALALDLRVYGCPANLVAEVIADTRANHIDALPVTADTRGTGGERE